MRESTQDASPGDRLGGRYLLERPLEQDASVWRAVDTHLDRPVAIRFVDETVAADGTSLAEQAAIAVGVRSPRIVTVLDVAILDAPRYLVEELVEDVGLDEVARRLAPLPPAEVERLATDLLAGLSDMSAAGTGVAGLRLRDAVATDHGTRIRLGALVASGLLAGEPSPEDAVRHAAALSAACLTAGGHLAEDDVPGRLQEAAAALPPGSVLAELAAGVSADLEPPPPAAAPGPAPVPDLAPDPDPAPPASWPPPDGEASSPKARLQPLVAMPAGRLRSRPSLRPPLGRAWAVVRAVPPGLAVAAVAVAALAVLDSSADALRPVPDLVGEHVAAARSVAEAGGFEVTTRPVSAGGFSGRVIDQDPPAGRYVDRGSTIELGVSAGTDQVAVPDVTGMQVADAVAALRASNLAAGQDVTYDVDATSPPGAVAATEPRAGAFVDAGTAVKIIASPPRSAPEDGESASAGSFGMTARAQRRPR